MESNEANPKFVGYFGHLEMIISFLTALKSDQDADILRADNFDKMSKRKFRTGNMIPFAANIVVVKNDDGTSNFFLNENPYHFTWCNKGVCTVAGLKEMFKQWVADNDGRCCNE